MEQWINNPWSDESVQGQHTGQGNMAGTWGMHKVKKTETGTNQCDFFKKSKREKLEGLQKAMQVNITSLKTAEPERKCIRLS